jgi:hypothetical protein
MFETASSATQVAFASAFLASFDNFFTYFPYNLSTRSCHGTLQEEAQCGTTDLVLKLDTGIKTTTSRASFQDSINR